MLQTPTGLPDQNWNSGGDDQPSQEKVKGLKRVEPHSDISTKAVRREEHNSRNHAEDRNVAQHRRGSIAHAIKEVDRFGISARLRLAAV